MSRESIKKPAYEGQSELPEIPIHFPRHDDWISAKDLAKLSPILLRTRMEELKPLISGRARETEIARRPLESTWNDLRRSGIFYHFVPTRYGGLELELEDLIDIMLPVGEACCSTAWVATFCVEHNYIFAQFPVEAQNEIFATHPYIIAPGVAGPPGRARRVSGGFMVTGHWKWASGIMNADWIMAMATIEGADTSARPESVFLVFPAKEATVYDVWHMSGMCGTGSNDFSVRDLFVPEHRALAARHFFNCDGEGALSHGNPMYRIPIVPFTSMTTMIPALGTARAAVSAFAEQMKQRKVVGTSTKIMDQPTSQARLAFADILVRDAEVLLRDTCRSMMDQVRRGDTADDVWRRQVRAQNARSMALCSEAIRVIMDGAGAGAHSLSNPLQRYQRDISAVRAHTLYDVDIAYESHGRGLLGLPPNYMMF